MELLSNQNNWTYYKIVKILGLQYIQYKHKLLPLIAEQEEGDDLFFVYSYYQKHDNLYITGDMNTFFIEIEGIGFNSDNVKNCNEETELNT